MRKIKLISFLIIAYTALSPNFIFARGTIKRLPSGIYGVVDENDKTIIPYNYHYIRKNGNYYIVENNDLKYGVFTEEGKLLIPCKYNSIQFRKGEFFVKSTDNLEGVVDTNGNVIVMAEYENIFRSSRSSSAFPFYNVSTNALSGLVKPGNKVLVPMRYTSTHLLDTAIATISWGLCEGIYDVVNQRELISPNTYLACGRLNNGYYYGRLTGGQVELIDPSGHVIWRRPGCKINAVVVETADNPFLHGIGDYTPLYQIIWSNGQSYVVDTTGQLVDSVLSKKRLFKSVAKCPKIENIVEDTIHHISLTLFNNDSGLWGVKNQKGEVIVPCKYDNINSFIIQRDGFIKCQHNQTMALYDVTGKCIIPEGIYTDYERLYDTRKDNLIYTKYYDKVGLCDMNGKCLIPANTYTDIRTASNSTKYLHTFLGEKRGIVTYEGTEILPPTFEEISILYRPIGATQKNAEYTLFGVKLNNLQGAYFEDGSLVVPPKYTDMFFYYYEPKNRSYFRVNNRDTEGVIDINGNIIVPTGLYSKVIFMNYASMPYYKVKMGDKEGCYDIHGNMLVAPSDYNVCSIHKSTDSSTGYAIRTEINEEGKTPLIQEVELYTNVVLWNSQQEEQRNQYIEEADAFFEADKFAKAAEYYSKAMQIRPADYLYFNRAVSYYNNNQYDKAIVDFNHVLSITFNTNLANRSNELIEEARIQKTAVSERRAAVGSIILGTLLGVTAAVVNSAVPTYQNNNAYSSYRGNSNTTNDSYDNDDDITDTNTKSKSTNLCLKCYGSGKCPQCNGTGCRTDDMFGTGTDCEHDCGICGGDGVCTKCGGKGRL